MSVTDNPAQSGTDSTQTSTDFDNPENWDYYDPDDEKQDNEAIPAAKGTEGEPDDSDETAEQSAANEDETEEAAPEDESEGEQETKEDVLEVLVPMPDGEKIPVSELRNGYMRQSDYSRKTQDLSQRVQWVDSRAHFIASQAEAAVSFLEQTMPPRPDPSLAHTNTPMYLAQERLHEAWVQHYNAAMGQAEQARAVQSEVMGAQQQQVTQEQLQSEFERLIQKMPKMADPKFQEDFIKRSAPVFEAAGLHPDSARGISEAAHLFIVNYAIKGFEAEKAMKVAKAKVANVPPAAPQKRMPGKTGTAVKNREAMNRLSRSGSIHDAVNVDWD